MDTLEGMLQAMSKKLDPTIPYTGLLKGKGFLIPEGILDAGSADNLGSICGLLPGDADVIWRAAEKTMGLNKDSVQTIASEVQQDENKRKPPEPKHFSEVSSREAQALMDELDLDEVKGNEVEPIIVPAEAPQTDSFAYEKYPDENTGTPFLMEHHKQQLQKFGVRFGLGGFKAYGLHSLHNLYRITAKSGQQYNGTVDGCIAPYGLGLSSAGKHGRIAYVHKQSQDQKQLHRDATISLCQDIGGSTISGSIKFAGRHKGESMMALFGAYAYNDYPLIIDLTDGVTRNLLQICGLGVYVWTDLSPREAYFKQAELFQSLPDMLADRRLRMHAIPEELQGPLKKLRSMRPNSGLSEQLGLVDCLPPSERIEAAYDIIESWQNAAAAAACPRLASDALDMFG